MGAIRTGTVGYSYRDWAGIFYPAGSPLRRQFNLYCQNFNVCELTQFTHQMPDPERVSHFAAQIKTDLRLFVRIHNTFTHCADIGLALTVARHFRKAMEPLFDAGKLAGLVANFPYAFKNTTENREYIQQLSSALAFEGLALQLDFRHASWMTDAAFEWMRNCGLGFVCVDEPQLPGLVSPHAVATADRVLVRLHGRNSEGWWSGNATTRYDYSYDTNELRELIDRYANVAREAKEVCFLFQNHWQAQSVKNALQWKALILSELHGQSSLPVLETQTAPGFDLAPAMDPAPWAPPVTPSKVIEPAPAPAYAAPAVDSPQAPPIAFLDSLESDESEYEDTLRPPVSLPLSEVKSRVSQALSSLQGSLDLPLRDE